MTVAELKARTGQKFQSIVLDKDDNIMFAFPIPGVDTFEFDAKEPQTLLLDDEEITARLEAWAEYINTLPKQRGRQKSSVQRKTELVKVYMDLDTKNRVMTCAEEQHKRVAQLIIDWIWSCPIKADGEGKR